MLWEVRDNTFGTDSYYWAGAATRLASETPVGVDAAYPIFRSNPTGYAYLLATAAAIVPDLYEGENVVVVALFGSRLSRTLAASSAALFTGSTRIRVGKF